MLTRLMVNVAGKTGPLCFDPSGQAGPLLASGSTSWAGLPFEVHRIGTLENIGEAGPVEGERGLLVIMDGQVEYTVRESGREQAYLATPGAVSLLSGDQRRELVRVNGNAVALALRMPREWFRRVALDELPSEFALPRFMSHDETVFGLVRAMWQEVARDASTGQVFAESLSLALLSYVTARLPVTHRELRGRLTEVQARVITDYIGDQLHSDLSVFGLAALVGLGPRRFSTLFRQTFGTTPHRYIMDRRLREGARLLDSGHDIADVARRVGFCSQSHFTAAFRESFGTTPRRYTRDSRSA